MNPTALMETDESVCDHIKIQKYFWLLMVTILQLAIVAVYLLLLRTHPRHSLWVTFLQGAIW